MKEKTDSVITGLVIKLTVGQRKWQQICIKRDRVNRFFPWKFICGNMVWCTFYPLAFQAERVLSFVSVHWSVCLFVCPSICNLYIVCMITHHRFELWSLKLHQTCILGDSQLVLKMKVIYLDLQGNFDHFGSELEEICIVCAINCNGFEIESLNMHLGILSAAIKNGGHWP